MTRKVRISIESEAGNNVALRIGAAGQYVDHFDFTVRDWATMVLAGGAAKDKALAKAIINLGQAAQEYFNYNLSNPADPDGLLASETYAVRNRINTAYDLSADPVCITAGLKEASLVLESDTSINIKFSKNANVKIDGKLVTLEEYNETLWYTQINGIPAKNIHELHKIELGGGTAWFGGLSWANSMLRSGTEAEKKLAGALYLYNEEARRYFNYQASGL